MRTSGRKAAGGGCECAVVAGMSLGLMIGVVVDAGATLFGFLCGTAGVEPLLLVLEVVAKAIGGYVVFGLIGCGLWILLSS